MPSGQGYDGFMCGRFQFVPKGNSIWRNEFGLPEDSDFPERVNLAPTQDAPVVVSVNGKASLHAMHWGLIPSWTAVQDRPKSFINARVETASNKPSFRDAWRFRRCLILATGYYEWARKGGPPTLIQAKDCEVFTFAGLWEPNLRNPLEGKPSCTILTAEAAPEIEELHARMPIMLAPDHREGWLEKGQVGFSLKATPQLPFRLHTQLVSRRLNKVAHDDASCLSLDVQDAPPPPGLFD